MPSKRRPLAEISEERKSLSSKPNGPPSKSSTFPLHPTPAYPSSNKSAKPNSPDSPTEKDPAQSAQLPSSFEPPVVEVPVVKGSKRQRISARDLPDLPTYNPVEVPFEPHNARKKPSVMGVPGIKKEGQEGQEEVQGTRPRQERFKRSPNPNLYDNCQLC
ncbi:hypothetical protein L873DRAFT_1849111 [Choiromyces venosus 120613-1]|uniref:Uncharacterized protein n=1 Tax=Choiromyces venosus 120613-1 TaxID=1336337 RepID=A0A3N4IYH6_9PEZI|nr:hypothetical protein L873DRAFT_1849111 [Choiromyces venosus 120613-1]